MEKIKFKIGNVEIGANSPISIQSMTNTKTDDTFATLKQIEKLANAGCEIIRVAVLNKKCAQALDEIVKNSPIPVVADIHFDYRLALMAMDNGINALRINPGNIGSIEHTKRVVEMAKTTKTPIRIGVNAGSLEKDLYEDKNLSLEEKMVISAKRHIKILEDLDFNLIKVSLKSSDVMTTIKAYQKIYNEIPYPLHVGLTEAGTLRGGIVKSSIGIGALLAQGIGDTIRVSLTENPIEEVKLAHEILKTLGLRNEGVNFISCPTCGRTQIDLIGLAKKVEEKFHNLKANITIATMGCPVNGPKEAAGADYGIAGAIKEGYIFKKGEIIKKVKEENLLEELENIIKQDLKIN
ncbi:MAG: flavodoxin-dependent (E)-4-hydroxy-3-methylbut-2-enyl-diphosphate synthase [Candidatus Gastranaerophilales bacterium]|nr:flavodoxin-dependent (E)-4-hydroxy-3-methylbut-2-enyl-diphosphate synthase [Candidatus Gastranaerophilales bacterium]